MSDGPVYLPLGVTPPQPNAFPGLECRWRGGMTRVLGRYVCTSPKITASNGVTIDHCRQCYARDHEPVERTPLAVDTRPATYIPSPQNDHIGVGQEVKVILASLGFGVGNCRCDELARKMDEWGPDGCDGEHREEIEKHLRDEAAKHQWVKRLLAVLKAVEIGLAKKINPTNPVRSILNEAIRRVRERSQNGA